MKNKNGFTLVELLAVIVILAVVLVIAIPKLNATKDSIEIKTFETNAGEILNLSTTHYQNNYASKLDVDEIVYTVSNGKIRVSGIDINLSESEISLTGTVTINSDGQVKAKLTDNKYCATKEYTSNMTVTKLASEETC